MVFSPTFQRCHSLCKGVIYWKTETPLEIEVIPSVFRVNRTGLLPKSMQGGYVFIQLSTRQLMAW